MRAPGLAASLLHNASQVAEFQGLAALALAASSGPPRASMVLRGQQASWHQPRLCRQTCLSANSW